MPPRRYSDVQLGAIIQRATELHEASGGTEHELTLDEVEQVATELGIPAAHVRAAARELNSPSAPKQGLLGAPFSVGVVRALPADVDDAQWEHIVTTLRRETGQSGRIGGVGLEWSHGFEDTGVVFKKTYAFVQRDDDGATLDLRSRYGGVATLAYLLAFAGGAAGAAAGIELGGLPETLSPPALIGLTASGGLGGMALVRTGLSIWADRQRDRLERLSDLVQRALGTDEPPALTADAASALLLDLDGLPDSPEAKATSARTRVH